jgi:5-methylcytosine-specific restriction enzyme subunit McrC
VCALTDDAAVALRRLGFELASKSEWWGAEGEPRDRTVIDVLTAGAGLWRVRVRDAIGVIVLPEAQIHVVPKIPANHFLYLAARSDRFPRTAGLPGVGSTGPFWELVLLWFLDAAEHLVRRGLIRDYADVRDTLPTIRGRVDVVSAGRRFYTGTLLFDCAFEDHVEDNPPNRLVLAAAMHAVKSPLPEAVRQRARRLVTCFDDVGPPTPQDDRWHPDRQTAHYRTPVTLARQVMRAAGRSLSSGTDIVWSFLIRTPELIEDGIRAILQEAFGVDVVTKTGLQLTGSTLTFNPDLRFWGARGVADVKYKLTPGDWNRADLYQILAFAAALRSFDAAILNFTRDAETTRSSLNVGDHRVCQISWGAGDPSPLSAASAFADAVGEWLNRFAVQVEHTQARSP